MCRFFGWKVECDDNPPWKKVNKIREWLAQPALKMQSYIYLDRGLTRIPPEIGTCINVEAINLSNNQIASLPSQIGTLTKLQSLSLGGNRLTSFLEDCSSLEELRALYLENNLLQTLPEGMSQLNLQTLDISFNPITTFPQVLYSIKSLRFLRLSEEQKTRFRTELANLKKINYKLRVSKRQENTLLSLAGQRLLNFLKMPQLALSACSAGRESE